MAFRKKAHLMAELKPDLLIVPECEHPDKFAKIDPGFKPSSTLWFGNNKNKGLAIFAFGDLQVELLDYHNEAYRMIIPISVSTDQRKFTLFAIWANNPSDNDGAYITQVWKAIKHYEKELIGNSVMLVGDFNSNTIWDTTRIHKNHSAVVAELQEKGIHSAYHHFFKEDQGQELRPTLYMYRHHDKPYHIDYCFASYDFIIALKSVEVGDKDYWLLFSDHVPLIATFDSSHF